MRLFSTEQVSKYHPDKYADQISDAILDACLIQDPNSRVACEVMVKDTTIVLGGEIKTNAIVDYESIARRVASKLNYTVDNVIDIIGKQSQEINEAVDAQELCAGDQGMMVGYATNESSSLLPYAFHVANQIIGVIERDVEYNPLTILKGDAKTQVTVDLDLPKDPLSVKILLISVCHKSGITLEYLRGYVRSLISGFGFDNAELIINPAGLWTVGGPIADCGLTGRKIVCDQYGGFVPVGGGAFSGKDPSKVDRSGAYAARALACDIVQKYGVSECVVQIAYAIGVAKPVSIYISGGDYQVDYNDFTPTAIIDRLKLREPKYERIAEGCHYR